MDGGSFSGNDFGELSWSDVNYLAKQAPAAADKGVIGSTSGGDSKLPLSQKIRNVIEAPSNALQNIMWALGHDPVGMLKGAGKTMLNNSTSAAQNDLPMIAFNNTAIMRGNRPLTPTQLSLSPNEMPGQDLYNPASFALPGLQLKALNSLKYFGIFRNEVMQSDVISAITFSDKHPLEGWPQKQVIDHVNSLGLKTQRDQLILWSGLGRGDAGKLISQQYAKMDGGITLEMTNGVAWLDKMDLFGSNSPFSIQESAEIWATVSKLLVNQASGQVRSLIGSVRPSSIYRAEQAEILTNRNILGLDEFNLKPRYGFTNK